MDAVNQKWLSTGSGNKPAVMKMIAENKVSNDLKTELLLECT